MKIIRFEAQSSVHWGILTGNTIQAVTLPNLEPTGVIFLPTEVQMLVPAEPSKIICVGKNYAAHAAEMGGEVPPEPGLFLKGPNALALHDSTIAYPSWTENFHFEGELGLVMKTRASKVSQNEALSYVLGYTCTIDLTARDKQKSDLQWFRAKGADHFLPFGPHLETDLNPSESRVTTKINGVVRQDSATSNMIYSVPFVISYVSQFMTLEAGDVIITGTPDGVGPLQPEDQIDLSIAGVGILSVKIGQKA
jgi:2-keto-4-pentenoate hydratase/2-oxohepta-3-ene-1,7-dioic acid hydratase in catechol pathway